jgi:DNA-binding LacI/PurR family transcriptional regulator
MANIRDIARRSGVSASTVSNIINGRYSIVKAQTRDRVLSAMRDLNYTPSPLFHGRDSPNSKTIGVAFTHVDGYVMAILEGILTVLQTYGWNMTTINLREWEDLHRNLRMYCDGRVDAMVVIDPATYVKLASALEDRNLPYVIVNDEADDPFASTVGVDVEAAAELAVNYLLDLGHRRIAMLRGVLEMDLLDRRYSGFVRSMDSRGIAILPELVRTGVYREESGYRNALELLRLPESIRPTAIFCGNDYIAAGAIRACKEVGLAVPRDVSIVGFDDLASSPIMEPPLTSVRRPLQQIGMETAEILMNRITGAQSRPSNEKPEPEHRILPADLIVRASTAPPAA